MFACVQVVLRNIIKWMIRHDLFCGLTRDGRRSKLLRIAQTHVLGGDNDEKYGFEVCTASPPTRPSDDLVWEPGHMSSLLTYR